MLRELAVMAHWPGGDLQVGEGGACAPRCEARGLDCKRTLHLDPKQEKKMRKVYSVRILDWMLRAVCFVLEAEVGGQWAGGEHRMTLKVRTDPSKAEREGLDSDFFPMVIRVVWP